MLIIKHTIYQKPGNYFSHYPSSIIFMSTLTCFFLALIPYATSITFNFTKFSSTDSQNIIFSGDAAYSSVEGIQVTTERSSVQNSIWLAGRATYISPFHLWDKNSTDLASFSTSFTFVIDSYTNTIYADGLTFFLAQNSSMITNRAAIGLPFNESETNNTIPFVAVEFDSYGDNTWDPVDPVTNNSIGDHIGININSMTSVTYKKWLSNIPHGQECRVMINYDSNLKNLSVFFTSVDENSSVWETRLEYIIDLRDVLPEQVIFGFSASTGVRYEKNNVRSWMFNSSEFPVDKSSNLSPTSSPDPKKREKGNLSPTSSLDPKKKDNKIGLLVGLVAGTMVLAIFLVILACYLWRKRKNNSETALKMNKEFEKARATIPRRYSYHELARSTADFVDTEKLGQGGFGGVYKGFLKDLGMYVAVKRLSNSSGQGIKEYTSEVVTISRLRHKNLVQLIGWCHEKEKLLLVYEFLENGSLDLHLFMGKSLLTWNTRYKIALGLASALLYLHDEWEQCVLHRDIKSSNVMLDSNFNPKLGDFGLARLVDHEKSPETTIIAGTRGYMAVEYVTTGKASKESDVFSFGVVALEIACGRKPIDLHTEEKKINLVEWVWDLYGTGTLLEAADPRLSSNFTEGEMTCLMIVGLWCAHPDSKQRPSMKQAIQVLNSEASLPILPSSMPYVPSPALPHFSSLTIGSINHSSKHSASLPDLS